MSAIAQTLTRPSGENKLVLEIKLDGGELHHFEIDAVPFYHSLKESIVAAAATHVIIEPVSHPSTFAEPEVVSPS